MATKKTDTFANIAAVRVQESAANTPTTSKFQFPFSIMDKMALIISRIEYWWSSSSVFDTTGDACTFGLVTASSPSDASNQADPTVIDSMVIQRRDLGTAASGFYFTMPFIKDFSSLPGGGILVAPAPLYAYIGASGASSAGTCWVKLFYTYIELSTDEYWQLVESRRIISS